MNHYVILQADGHTLSLQWNRNYWKYGWFDIIWITKTLHSISETCFTSFHNTIQCTESILSDYTMYHEYFIRLYNVRWVFFRRHVLFQFITMDPTVYVITCHGQRFASVRYTTHREHALHREDRYWSWIEMSMVPVLIWNDISRVQEWQQAESLTLVALYIE